MKEKDISPTKTRGNIKSFHKKRCSLKPKVFNCFSQEKEIQNTLNFNKSSMKSDNKVINFSEMIPYLLEQIKAKKISNHHLVKDNLNNSFGHDSNSSEINDDKSESNDNNNINNINNYNMSNSIKIPKLKIDNNDSNEYNNLEAIITYRQKNKNESPNLKHRKYSKDNKDSLILKLHKYFFQDGEIENIDTLIKYKINKIKLNDNNNIENNNPIYYNENEDFNYLNIKSRVINLMITFGDAFDKENKNLLISAIKDLNNFSETHKFDYVTQLTLEWLDKLKDKKYEKCELKYIGYYNQIRDIMEKMLNELKKKADLIIISKTKKNKENKIVNENKNMNSVNYKNDNNFNDSTIKIPNMDIQRTLDKKKSIMNKEELLKTKEIMPIKIDIEIQNTLTIDEIEEILKNLDECDLGNLGCNKREVNNNNKKILNKNINNRYDNELEAFSYPFKDDSLCYIF